jgi:hypothetical protein
MESQALSSHKFRIGKLNAEEPSTLVPATDEESNDSPLGRGKGPQALGWVLKSGADPPRRSAH